MGVEVGVKMRGLGRPGKKNLRNEQNRTRFRTKRACETERFSHQTRLLTKKNGKNCKKLVKIARNLQKLAKIVPF